MISSARLPGGVSLACRKQGIVPTRYLFTVEITTQSARLFERNPAACPESSFPAYGLTKEYRCSTSRFGIGSVAGSNCTPLGLHRIAEKIGGGWPVGTVFKSRQVIGFTWQGLPLASITHRIMWLEGLEPGLNRGGNVDTHDRYVYIHGTGDEPSLGRPASHGCIHLAANDLMPLYDFLPSGTLVWIQR
ncbi:L,D-transpeptidase [Pedosphaera parvula]|uniref:ErfK/YbiS/YcfS/YnhG family protein n=1 Tax=Pedosphaera parvula (strain Ellin514) TaxID=320771 RepID=B9XDU1_PEDPL|nr:L,D-transpeptidase [Pedosphaera parvula]EEF61832.1 ErfK/YbiS/YcfS/YnhG family protein [Pedosphaera parvula Ellin514]